MKKSIYFLVTTLLVFLAFVLGVFFGRSNQDGTISAWVDKENDDIGKININTATMDELCLLPGISEITAQKIIDYREKYGDFLSKSELCEISGISEEKLEELIDYITI